MGTRNVTIIKYNGEERVRQYGQWDGYPTTALGEIVRFLKADGAIEHLKQNLVKCKLIPEDQWVHYPKGFTDIGLFCSRRYMDLMCCSYDVCIEKIVNATKFSAADVLNYYLVTRDTGYNIMDVLTTSAADAAMEMVLVQTSETKCDWQIEAVNIIDLDAQIVTSYWHDAKREWSFDCLPDLNELMEFEKEGD